MRRGDHYPFPTLPRTVWRRLRWRFAPASSNPSCVPTSEVDPIVWAKFRRFLDGAAGSRGGGPKAAIHSRLDSALGSHPCVALSRQHPDTPIAKHHENLLKVGRHAQLRIDDRKSVV